ncbi:Protein PafC [Thauera sp. GDN1]|uniref:helix-turn-helix transcriptional regulator n=1 Tax=Thauera sp. GDN1 TaxID=2944810 RepID=UPI002479D973|nr:YafY family protein [Thauera sp. GDN1]WEN41951.1 Protein PafC [Thauera sp. GDN1]
MNRSERFYKIDQLLSARKVVTRQALLDELEISWATLKRDLAFLKDRFNAPIIYDRDVGGYRFAEPSVGPSYELPGLWFSADETYALLTMHRLLSDLEPRLLAPHVAPLLSRLEHILGQQCQRFEAIAQRIHLARIGNRIKDAEHFSELSRALLQRRQVRITHYSRERDERTTRIVSPQRLTFYRNNWYLEVWCHRREALRRFSVDAIESVDTLEDRTMEMPPEALDAAFSSSYGIYGGPMLHRAELRFSPTAARWVAREEWHPDQVGAFDPEGRYRLTIPYADPTELVMDILRHGHHVEVLAPDALRARVRDEITLMARHYSA